MGDLYKKINEKYNRKYKNCFIALKRILTNSVDAGKPNNDLIGKWKLAYVCDTLGNKLSEHYYDSLVFDTNLKYSLYKLNKLLKSGSTVYLPESSAAENKYLIVFLNNGENADNTLCEMNAVLFKGKDSLQLIHQYYSKEVLTFSRKYKF